MSSIIVADGTMHFDGKKFTSKGTPKVFATRERAVAQALTLAKKFPVLYKHLIAVKTYKPAKSARKNPGRSPEVEARRLAYLAQRQANATADARRLLDPKRAPRGVEIVHVPPRKNPRGRTRKNPAGFTVRPPRQRRASQINIADDLLEAFTGTRASKEVVANVRPIRTGLVVGKLSGVMYAADRGDGVHEYCHRFKSSSRPLLIADHDGTQLGIVGGRYQFTDRGIVDK